MLAVGFVSGAATPEEQSARSVLEALIIGMPLAAGFLAARRPQTLRFGVLLIAAAIVWALTALGESTASLPYSIGRVSSWLLFPPVIYLMLAFPEGRLRSRLDRVLFGAITALIVVFYFGSALLVEAYPLYTPWATCVRHCPANAFLVVDAQPDFVGAWMIPLRETLAVVLLIVVTVVLLTRWRRALPLRRRMLTPLIASACFSTLSLVAYYIVRKADSDGEAAQLAGWIWALSVPAVAGGFLVGLLRRRAILGDVLHRLSHALAEPLDVRRLRHALAVELEDPSIEILVPDEIPGRWRDSANGVTTRSQALAAGRAVSPIDGRSGALLVHDPALLDDTELFESVRALVLVTLGHEQLVTQLAGSLAELEASRKRIARVADMERSRIERDLHDGAQQRLIGLRMKVSLAEELARRDPVEGVRYLHELGTDVEAALEQLRTVAHGVYPSLLSDRGLADALSNAVADIALPVRLATHGLTRQPGEIETAVYFTCLEAVQNVLKHAATASGIWISLAQDGVLAFEVRDDGSGFVPPAGEFSGGLRNMKDRVEAVGGSLTIDSAPGHGTRIRGRIPLGAITRGT